MSRLTRLEAAAFAVLLPLLCAGVMVASDMLAADGDVTPPLEETYRKGAANGYASLDANTRVPLAQLGSGTPDTTKFLRGDGSWQVPPSAEGGVPAGVIAMWSGSIASIPAGWQLCDGTNGSPDLRDKFVKCVAAAEEPGTTGGAATHAHGAGTYATSAHAGTAVADHASHTHTYTQVPNHTHPITDPTHNHTQNAHTHVVTSQTATTGSATSYEHGTLDTSSAEAEVTEVTGSTTATNIAAATGITATDNPTGGVATGTTAGPSATLTHGVTQPSAHTMSGTSESVNGEPAHFELAFIFKLP